MQHPKGAGAPVVPARVGGERSQQGEDVDADGVLHAEAVLRQQRGQLGVGEGLQRQANRLAPSS